MSLIYVHDGDINEFLNGVHDAIINKYLKGIYNQKGNIQTYTQNAKTLQGFLQKIKIESTKKDNEKSATFKMVIEEVNNILGRNKAVQLFTHAHKKEDSVDIFEREINALFLAITKSVAIKEDAEKLTIDNFSVGGKNVTVDLSEKYFKKWVQEAIEEVGKTAQEELTYQDSWGEVYARQGKPDSQGVVVEIKANTNSDLLKIYNLIKNAKFSEKNYRNTYWHKDENTGKNIPTQGSPTLHLGNSNAFKAYYGVLTDLRVGEQSTIKSFYHAWGCFKKGPHNNHDVGKNILMIRQVYELVGSGTGTIDENGKFNKIGKVDYLIYNVPDSKTEIYVKSVPEILNHLFKLIESNKKQRGNPFTQDIAVTKQLFKNIVNDLT